MKDVKITLDTTEQDRKFHIDNLHKVVELLIRKIDPYVIYLFGSAAKGEMRDDSDMDFAFYSSIEMEPFALHLVKQEISEILNRDVDLVDMKKVSTVFNAQIISSGYSVYCSDSSIRANMEIKILKEYALLNEERAEILQNIRKSGKIYA